MRVPCPGRYRLAGRNDPRVALALQTPPEELLVALGVAAEVVGDGKSKEGCMYAEGGFYRAVLIGGERLGREDDVYVARFLDRGGGGLLTYLKRKSGVFVHTLNTDSNLRRKLEAMGLDNAVEMLWKALR